MVGEREAAGMSYREYKIALWSRLVAFWHERVGSPNFDPAFVKRRMTACADQLEAHKRAL